MGAYKNKCCSGNCNQGRNCPLRQGTEQAPEKAGVDLSKPAPRFAPEVASTDFVFQRSTEKTAEFDVIWSVTADGVLTMGEGVTPRDVALSIQAEFDKLAALSQPIQSAGAAQDTEIKRIEAQHLSSVFYRDDQFDKLSNNWAGAIIAKERGAGSQTQVCRAFDAMCEYLDARLAALAVPAAPTVQSDLSAAVQGLSCDLNKCTTKHWVEAYQQGHRDARFAAFELVSKSLALLAIPQAPKIDTSGITSAIKMDTDKMKLIFKSKAAFEKFQTQLHASIFDQAEPVPQAPSLTDAPEVDQSTRQAKLIALADRIDHEKLWRLAAMDHDKLTSEQKDRMNAGVNLRRYADILAPGHWVLIRPTGGIQYGASTLDKAVEMAKRFLHGELAASSTKEA